MDFNEWEEIPIEELWFDGELSKDELMRKLFVKVTMEGSWKVMRKKNETYYKLKGEE